MKKVCLFNQKPIDDFHGYRLETFDPLSYFDQGAHWEPADFLRGGLAGYRKRRALWDSAAGVDRLYRERDPSYMRMVGDFIDRFRDFDAIVMGAYNFIHPELLARELARPVKVLGFIDDPYSTYTRGIPYLWAFDGAFYISPGYIDGLAFEQALRRWSDKPVTWWPLVPMALEAPPRQDDTFFRDRAIDVCYVGYPAASKAERLIRLKQHFGPRMRIHGRWPAKGYYGYLRALLGKPVFAQRVTSLSMDERRNLYWNSKIAFNMHVSDEPCETGNARMYEAPAHGMLMVCDKGGGDAHARVFEPGREALFYDNLDEAIEIIEHFLKEEHTAQRCAVARAGFERYWRDYEWEANLLRFLAWTVSLKQP